MVSIPGKACATKRRARNQRDAPRESSPLPPDVCRWVSNTAAAAMQSRRTKKAGASWRAPAGIAKLEECR
jgi:hypothetical protein